MVAVRMQRNIAFGNSQSHSTDHTPASPAVLLPPPLRPQIQQDEDKPRKLEVFTRRNLVPHNAIVSLQGKGGWGGIWPWRGG